MTNISPTDAFLMFAKWRDEKPQVQFCLRKVGSHMVSSPVSIFSISGNEERIDVEIVLNGQNQKCALDFRGASFSYGEPLDSAVFPEFAEKVWASYLSVDCPTGTQFLFAERSEWIGE
jgi:hypothetical protein